MDGPHFECTGVRVEPYAAAPTLLFRLRVAESTGARIDSIALRCQLRIEPQRRRYSPGEQERLADLFGEVSRWADTLKPIQFTTVSTVLPGFTGMTETELPVPCSYDLEIASARYFNALRDDTVPLLLLFSGTVFGRGEDGSVRVHPVPWSAECPYRLPVAVWREMVDRYFPNSGWLRLHRDTLDALARYKTRHALATWDQVVLALLAPDEVASHDG